MDIITNFYDKLFLYYFNFKKNSDSTPEYFPIIIISFAQATNLMVLITFFFYFFKINFSSLPKIFLVAIIGTVVFNFYAYVTKGRKETILRKNIKLPLSFKIFSFFYVILSLAFPLVLIYFFNEFG